MAINPCLRFVKVTVVKDKFTLQKVSLGVGRPNGQIDRGEIFTRWQFGSMHHRWRLADETVGHRFRLDYHRGSSSLLLRMRLGLGSTTKDTLVGDIAREAWQLIDD